MAFNVAKIASARASLFTISLTKSLRVAGPLDASTEIGDLHDTYDNMCYSIAMSMLWL